MHVIEPANGVVAYKNGPIGRKTAKTEPTEEGLKKTVEPAQSVAFEFGPIGKAL